MYYSNLVFCLPDAQLLAAVGRDMLTVVGAYIEGNINEVRKEVLLVSFSSEE